MFGPSPTPSRLCKTPVEVPSGTRPRATACTAPVGCLTSATTGSTGRRRFRKGVSQLATCSSTTTYSTSTTAIIVRSVFSCVASRKRAPTGCLIGLADEKSFDRENSSFRVPSGQRSQLFSWQTSGLLSRAQRETVGPLPSREESISFLSPARAAGAPTFCDATESRQRTQPRGLRPLGHPPTTATRRKFGLAPTPLRLCKTPVGVPSGTAEDGDSASRYFLRPKLSRDLPTTADATPLRTGLLLENRDRRSRAPPPPPAEGATSLLLRRLRGRLRKRTSPHGLWPRAWGNTSVSTLR